MSILGQTKNEIRVSDIAERLDKSKASVNSAINNLKNDNNENSIEFEHYEVFLYSRNVTFICNTKIKDLWGNNNSEKDNLNDNDIDKFSESCDNGINEKKNTDMIMIMLRIFS